MSMIKITIPGPSNADEYYAIQDRLESLVAQGLGHTQEAMDLHKIIFGPIDREQTSNTGIAHYRSGATLDLKPETRQN